MTLEEGCRQISRCAYGTGHKASAGACTGRRAGISGICAVCGADERIFFEPNDRTHKAFGDALRRRTEKKGVQVLACDCEVTVNTLEIQNMISVRLD